MHEFDETTFRSLMHRIERPSKELQRFFCVEDVLERVKEPLQHLHLLVNHLCENSQGETKDAHERFKNASDAFDDALNSILTNLENEWKREYNEGCNFARSEKFSNKSRSYLEGLRLGICQALHDRDKRE